MKMIFPSIQPVGVQPVYATIRASIIIVVYNNWNDLFYCLESIRVAKSKNLEIIVVDNCSERPNPTALAEQYPEVKFIQSSTNLGFGGGNNLGVQSARGEYLVFLNPDATVEAGWLEALIDVLEKNPDAGMATSKILLMDNPDTINTCGNDIHISGLTLCRGMGWPSETYDQIEEVNAVSGAAFAIRKDLFRELMGFDDIFFMYMEDTDLSLRARLAGWHILYVPDSVIYHKYTLRLGPQKTYYQERNRYIMVIKCFQWRTLLVLFPAFLLAEVVSWGFVFVRERRNINNKIRAYFWILRHLGVLLNVRRNTQMSRKVEDRLLLSTMQTNLAFEQTGAGSIATLAHQIFDPLFYCCKKFFLSLN